MAMLTSVRQEDADMGSNDQRPPDNHDLAERENGMPEETESVERYRRAHEVIERMRTDRRPDRSGASDDDPRLDATAALLRSAAPGAANVDPIFAARLLARLEAGETPAPLAAPSQPTPARPSPTPDSAPPRARRASVSRRGLMLGGLGAAAAAVIGGAAGAAIEAGRQAPTRGNTNPPPQVPLILDGVGSWVAVAHVASVPIGAVVRFQTAAVIGYLRHTSEGFIALSGVCTHMACLLQWNGVDRTFDCPCHGSRFLETGQQAPGARYAYPPLPSIKTKVEQEQVWVYVISDDGSTPDNSTPTVGGY
jgi:nitrite reductase/ring-hydroxylating ferredoxin subunit